ncbi:MAG TPA: hypothetical protein VJR89_15390 [Polyangiales bacterium]|nr:hypothetical protein [Polyangiales bacterium]
MDLTRIERWLRSLHPKWLMAAAAIIAVASWLLLLPRQAPHELEPAPEQPQTTAAPKAPNAQPAPPPAAAAPAPTTAPTAPVTHEALWRRMASENSGDRIEALRAMRDAGAVDLLPNLLQFDLASDPEAAPTLISVATDLGVRGDEAQRSATARQLSQWLSREVAREGRDARSNTASLVEALGRIPSPEATRALVEALDGQDLPLHLETVAVQGLARTSDAARARPAVERFAARLKRTPASDDFARELQQEAVSTAERALAHWSG